MDHPTRSSDPQHTQLKGLLRSNSQTRRPSLIPPAIPRRQLSIPPSNQTEIQSPRSRSHPLPIFKKAMTTQVKQIYPMSITDLGRSDLSMLTAILRIENQPRLLRDKAPTGAFSDMVDEVIRDRIAKLPGYLQRSLLLKLVSNTGHRPAILCGTHKNLNIYIIGHIFNLVRKEVTEHLRIMDWFSDMVSPDVKNLIRALQAIQGMWWYPSTSDTPPPIGGATFQWNRCEACMLSRVITEPMFLRNLRATLLSRTRTKSRHRAPKLLPFVDEGIKCHKESYRLFVNSSTMAFGMKGARKAAIKAFKKQEKVLLQKPGQERDESTHSIVIYMASGDEKERDQLQEKSEQDLETGFIRKPYRDTVDDIITQYEVRNSLDQFADETEMAMPIKPSPLSIKKIRATAGSPPPSSAGSSNYSRSVSQPKLQDPLRQFVEKKSPLATLTEGVRAMLRDDRSSDGGGDSEELAREYQSILSPQSWDDSRDSWEDDLVEVDDADTTWSLVCESTMPTHSRESKGKQRAEHRI